MKLKLRADYKPNGDQPDAIKKLVQGIKSSFDKQTLLGVTGSGKTFTIANVIEETQLPTLVIAHNKTLAAQLCSEFRQFFPASAVEYFVSYYDYYQPEAYLPSSDTYIEKEAQINKEIERLRHACTQSLLTRKDVIIIASVSAIYGLGSPEEYKKITLHLTKNQKLDRRGMLEQLIEMQFTRTNADLIRGQFRMRGQVFEIMPINEDIIYRFEISDKIDLIEAVDPITRIVKRELPGIWLFPAVHYIINDDIREKAFHSIRAELKTQLALFKKQKKLLEYERLKRRVNYDLEMIENVGYCSGIENYSRHFDNRKPGEAPFNLMDYFKANNKQFLTIIDESHVTLPQIRAMYKGDQARKSTLVEHGFRLPSARDNRPLKFDEFEKKNDLTIYTSATPTEFETKSSNQIVEQIVRPTGLVDPEVDIRPITGKNSRSQIEDLIIEIEKQIKKGERTLVTTLTKRMAEDLTDHLKNKKINVSYLHSDVDTLQRIEIITELRRGTIDVLVGVNLLREGLDIPEVSLVAILDADKEGFLRNDTSLIQTIGRAARNADGRVLLYADNITGSIKRAVGETERRRKKQLAYNKKNGITPKTIEKNIKNILEEFGLTVKKKGKKSRSQEIKQTVLELDLQGDNRPIKEIIRDKEMQMKEAAHKLEFELAAILRDEIRLLKINL
ncbi:excinuclease ABC subunit UvrB [Candidatus Kuenenbacteria bacterium]|nr:excinuclease ABC subunit UvrB [Candidatus Kuenenbacteria bacterium]